MAPEQLGGRPHVDHRADIYSLGVVLYEMLTGELPVGRFAPPSRKVEIDVRLDEVVLRTLEQEPGLRYQHASEIKTDVQTIASTADPALAATVIGSRNARPRTAGGRRAGPAGTGRPPAADTPPIDGRRSGRFATAVPVAASPSLRRRRVDRLGRPVLGPEHRRSSPLSLRCNRARLRRRPHRRRGGRLHADRADRLLEARDEKSAPDSKPSAGSTCGSARWSASHGGCCGSRSPSRSGSTWSSTRTR